MEKRSPLLFLLLILSIVLMACNSSIEPASPVEVIEITDSTGHRITLDGLPHRVVIAGKATIMVQDAVFLFEEANERVAAMEKRSQSVFEFLVVVDPGIENRELLEKNAGPEQIAATNPDLVILKNFMAEELGAPLEEIGIPVLYVDMETPEAFYRDISVLGQVFGAPERADEIIRYYEQRVELVERITAGVEDEQRPRVLLLEYSTHSGEAAFHVPPAAWLQTMMVELAGGQPIWIEAGVGGGWTVVTMEQIAAWNPDQIFVIDYSGHASEVVQALKVDPLWRQLSAVKDDHLYAFGFDFYSWDQPDTRWVLGLQWLATKIHPERTGEIDILAEAENFYTFLYFLDRETYDTKIFPLMTGDIP